MRRALTRRGFTLMELLAVIAIIALLMAILMPSLEKARRQGRRVACAGNLKSMAYACVMYGDDYSYNFPYCHMVKILDSGSYAIWNRRDDKDSGFVAHGLLYYHGLIKEPLVFYCPANRDPTIRFGEAQVPGVGQGVGGGCPATGRPTTSTTRSKTTCGRRSSTRSGSTRWQSERAKRGSFDRQGGWGPAKDQDAAC